MAIFDFSMVATLDDQKINLTQTENFQTYSVAMQGSNLDGEISNRVADGDFQYKPSEFEGFLTANCLRAVADKLDELNGANNNG